MRELLQAWGKLGPEGRYHPALFHMLDVGNVARALLGAEAPPRFRAVMASALNSKAESLVDWLPLLVGLHDIGKISSPFQGQDSNEETQLARKRLQSAGFTFGDTQGVRYPHQQIGAVWIRNDWARLEAGLPDPLVRVERDAVGGHHGVYAPPGELTKVGKYLRHNEPAEWAALRSAAYEILRRELAPGWNDWPTPQHRRAATMALTGFIVLCDWLGSESNCFQCESGLPLDRYRPLSARRAREMVKTAGFLPTRRPPSYLGFASTFPAIKDPRPLQEVIDRIPESALAWPALFIIEAPTGEGKTEAALALAARLGMTGPSGELYVGMPTQATGNQMFGRVHAFANRGGSGNRVKLIHGQSFLVEDDLVLRLQGDADSGSAAAASRWFAPKKRALLAPFGVGTVDQVELAALNARHYMLRLLGLAGKVVIIDEVHAYDTYMSTILEEAIRWLASLGSSVILLSATLPTSRYRALASAFCRALPEADRPSVPEDRLPYPSLTGYAPGDRVLCNPSAFQPQRSLGVSFINDEAADEEAKRLLSLVQEGGAVCRICNTVAHAQGLYESVRKRDKTIAVYLLHSRFPLEQRQEIEERLSERFGPETNRSESERHIVIGTQVIEQSLDLDFDAMVSDFAPIDLLLQRAGRLHRHKRSRPAMLTYPVLYVQLPTSTDGHPEFGVWELIYGAYILWTTWLVLDGRRERGDICLALPADYRPIIDAAYPEGEYSLPAESPWAVALRDAYREHLKEEARMKGEALLRLVPEPHPSMGITEGPTGEFEEEDEGRMQGWGAATTRLGAQSVQVIPLYVHHGRLTLDEVGDEAIPSTCDRGQQLRLLRRTIPVTITDSRRSLLVRWEKDRDEFRALFNKDSLLRNALPLVLEGDRQRVGQYTIQLMPCTGLVVTKE